jgi:hypothetical protein
MSAKSVSNEMGTQYLDLSAKRCDDPECKDKDAKASIVWPHSYVHFIEHIARTVDTQYQEGYDAGYDHALEILGIEDE